MDRKQIEEIVRLSIKSVSKIEEVDPDENLFHSKYKIASRDMVYIINRIEQLLGFSITQIFETASKEIMTVNHLTGAIMQIQSQGRSIYR